MVSTIIELEKLKDCTDTSAAVVICRVEMANRYKHVDKIPRTAVGNVSCFAKVENAAPIPVQAESSS